MIPIADILSSLFSRHRAAQLAGLDKLSPTERQLVEQAVASLPTDATIDLESLVARARRKRAEQRPAGRPWRYWVLELATDAEREAFRRRVQAGEEPNDAMREVMAGAARRDLSPQVEADIEPDPDGEIDDESKPAELDDDALCLVARRRDTEARAERVARRVSRRAPPEEPPAEPYSDDADSRTWGAVEGLATTEDCGFIYPP